MLEKILLPLDGSALGARIVPLVRRMLDRRDAVLDESAREPEVTLLRVVSEAELRRGEQLGRDELVVARRELEAERARLGASGRRATCEVIVGDAAATIVDEASRRVPGLIVMSTHGRTGTERMIRGSVAERVLQASPHPVLLANPFALEEASAPGALPFQRILVPLDGSERSSEILGDVAELARCFDAEVVLLHVLPELAEDDASGITARELEAEGRRTLEAACARLPGLRVEAKLASGVPAPALLRAITDTHADLLAMTTHGRTGLARWAFGSVAETVLHHGRCPVLVRRTGGAARAQPREAA